MRRCTVLTAANLVVDEEDAKSVEKWGGYM